MVGMTYMPFDAVSSGCAVELSQKRHMTKTDTHTKAQVSHYDTPSRRRITQQKISQEQVARRQYTRPSPL